MPSPVVTFRTSSEQLDHLKAQAEKQGKTVTKIINEAIESAKPIEPIVGDLLKDLTEGSGLSAGEIINFIILDWWVRNAVEQEMFGTALSHPFWKVGPGQFVDDFDELYLFLRQKYAEMLQDVLGRAGDSK